MRIPGRYAHARHILVGSKSEAQAILNEITNARKPLRMFKKMARDYSKCPTAEKKGDLGEFHERQYPTGEAGERGGESRAGR